MKKLFSLLLVLIMVVCLVPLSAKEASAETYITEVGVNYDRKAVALRTDMTGRQVTEALRAALRWGTLNAGVTGGVHIDYSSSCLAKRTGDGMVSYVDFEKLDSSDEYLSYGNEYYFLINLEEDSGYVFDVDNLPEATVNGYDADGVSWYGLNYIRSDGSVDIIKRVYIGTDDCVYGLSIKLSRVKIQKGTSCQLEYEIKGTDTRIDWEILEPVTSSGTKVTDGLIQVGSDEMNYYFTVRASSVFNKNLYDDVYVTVIDEPVEITGVTISPSSVTLRRGQRCNFDVTVTGTDYLDYECTLIGQQSSYTRLSGNELIISDNETASTVTVRARSVRNPDIYADAVVTVLPKATIENVSIEFDDTGFSPISAAQTGEEVTQLLRNALDSAVLSEGISIDRSSSCLAERTGEGMVSYEDFVKLDHSTEPLDPSRDYYFIINLEETTGYVFDTEQFPTAVVNGSEAAGVSWYSTQYMGPTGSIDIIVKVNVSAYSAVIHPISFEPLYEGYTYYDIPYVPIEVENTGVETLYVNGSSIWISNPEAFCVTWYAVPGNISPGDCTDNIYLSPREGLSAGTYETEVYFREEYDSMDVISIHVTISIRGPVREISINMPDAYAGRYASDYNYSRVEVLGTGCDLAEPAQWCCFDMGTEYFEPFSGEFRMYTRYFMRIRLLADDCHYFIFNPESGAYTINSIVLNGEEVTPLDTVSYYGDGSRYVQLILPYDVLKDSSQSLTVTPYPASAFSEGTDYYVDGNEVNVKFSLPCKVGYLSGGKYVACELISTSGGWHTFRVPDGIEEVIIVIKGDADLNGQIRNSDATKIKSYLKTGTGFDAVQYFAADVDGNGQVKNSDATKVKAYLKGNSSSIEW